MSKTVFGVFASRDEAEDAINDLENIGYAPKDISAVMKDQGESERFARDTGTEVASGAVTGATAGGAIGGLAGLLVGIGAIAIPGLGSLLVAGPIAAALGLTGAAATTISGAITGAAAGGFIGALMGLGVSREDAKVYEERIREGGVLLAVPAFAGEEDEVREILENNGAVQVRAIDNLDRWKEAYDQDFEPIRSYGRDESSYYAGSKGGRVTRRDRRWLGERQSDITPKRGVRRSLRNRA